ncbi:MAG: caspase family protein [Treponema sp.]|nr:caspase family protein [Treponema sp.]
MKKRILLVAMAMMCAVGAFCQTRKLNLEMDKKDAGQERTAQSFQNIKLATQEMHTGRVVIVKYIRDDKNYFTVAEETKLWDSDTGLLIETFPYGELNYVDISQDAKYISYCDKNDFTSYIYDIFQKKVVYSNKNRGKIVFSPDNTTFALLPTSSKEIFIYDLKTFKLLRTITYKVYEWKDIVFSDDSTYLLAYTRTGSSFKHNIVAVWNIKNFKNCFVYYQDKGDKKIRELENACFSHDGQHVAWTMDDNNVSVCSMNGVLEKSFVWNTKAKRPAKKVGGLKFSKDSNKLLIADGDDELSELDYTTLKITNKIRLSENLFMPNSIGVSRKRNEFVVGGYGLMATVPADFSSIIRAEENSGAYGIGVSDYILYYEYVKTVVTENGKKHEVYKEHVVNCSSGQSENLSECYDYNFNDDAVCDKGLYYVYNGCVYFVDFKTKEQRLILKNVSFESVRQHIYVSENGKILVWKDISTRMNIFDVEKNKMLQPLELKSYFNIKKISPSGKYIHVESNVKNMLYEVSSGRLINVPNNVYENDYEFSKDDSFFCLKKTEECFVYNTASWTIEKKFKVSDFRSFDKFCFSHDNRLLAFTERDMSNHNFLHFMDLSSGRVIKKIDLENGTNIYQVNISSDDSKCIVKSTSGFYVYSVATGSLLATIVVGDKNNWLAYTPEGYFVGSPDGINKLTHLVDGMEVYELGRMYEALYRPDLVAAKLAGKDVGKPVLQDVFASGDSPKVWFAKTPSVMSRNVKLEFAVQDTGGGVGYVYLSHNGKVMQVSNGEESVRGRKYIYSCDVTLASGNNVFEVYAANSMNKIESRHASMSLNWQGESGVPNLYVLAMGINVYHNTPSLNLNYSVADTKGIVETFKTTPGGLYQTVNIMSLLDSEVNKTKIQNAFDALSAKVQPDDMFVLYLAGHGLNQGGEYYYVPADFEIKSDAEIPQKIPIYGISKHFLIEKMSEIKALNTAILLDTCDSGAFISGDANLDLLAQKTALERFAHTSGQVIITASAGSQEAQEGYKGHGFFTYTLMNALSGGANYNGDVGISIKEISSYVEKEVPALCARLKLQTQTPWTSPARADFFVVATGNKKSAPYSVLVPDSEPVLAEWVTKTVDDSYSEAKNSALDKTKTSKSKKKR